MRYFRRDVTGFSLGNHAVELCYGVFCPPFQYHEQDYLNAAQTGAMFVSLPKQLLHVINVMKSSASIDYHKDYKLVTIFIGSNDLCMACTTSAFNPFPPASLLNATLHSLIPLLPPRTVVNIIGLFNISQIHSLQTNPDVCSESVITKGDWECPCAGLSGSLGRTLRLQMDRAVISYNAIFQSFAADSHNNPYLLLKNILILYDPTLESLAVNSLSSETQRRLISHIDCFHPSMWAHQRIAVAVWNNLFRREKREIIVEGDGDRDPPYCPNEDDRIQ